MANGNGTKRSELEKRLDNIELQNVRHTGLVEQVSDNTKRVTRMEKIMVAFLAINAAGAAPNIWKLILSLIGG